MGDIRIGEITQHTLLRIIKLNRRKQRDTPDRLDICRGFIYPIRQIGIGRSVILHRQYNQP